MRIATLTLSVVLAGYSQVSTAMDSKECFLKAKTELEKVYCQILAKGGAATLPNLNEFRRNPVSTQRLLLARPAKKYHISLPGAPNKKAKAPPPRPQAKVTQKQAPNKKHTTVAKASPPSQLDHCTLNKERILCGQQNYYLSINVPAKHLNKRVLSKDNILRLRPILNNESDLQYLSDLYPQYIEKMLLIGLGDSTMSFTKFAALYKQSKTQGKDFSQRFGKMYELLKTERKQQAIKARYQNNFPANLKNCMFLSNDLIACDNVKQNWVYKKVKSI